MTVAEDQNTLIHKPKHTIIIANALTKAEQTPKQQAVQLALVKGSEVVTLKGTPEQLEIIEKFLQSFLTYVHSLGIFFPETKIHLVGKRSLQRIHDFFQDSLFSKDFFFAGPHHLYILETTANRSIEDFIADLAEMLTLYIGSMNIRIPPDGKLDTFHFQQGFETLNGENIQFKTFTKGTQFLFKKGLMGTFARHLKSSRNNNVSLPWGVIPSLVKYFMLRAESTQNISCKEIEKKVFQSYTKGTYKDVFSYLDLATDEIELLKKLDGLTINENFTEENEKKALSIINSVCQFFGTFYKGWDPYMVSIPTSGHNILY